jgi:hypothetical protein
MLRKYDCSFDFNTPKSAKKYGYLVVTEGDLDLNGAMLLRRMKDLREYLKEHEEYGRGKVSAFKCKLIGVFSGER